MPRIPAFARAAAAPVLVLALAGCGAPSGGTVGTQSAAAPLTAHAHGVYAAPDGSTVLVATHNGLYDYTRDAPTLIGEANDYMGFTGDASALYASGHPGPGSSLPNPLGLMRSTDGGRTWERLSNQGLSDFHALAVTQTGVVGYDGQLKASTDLKAWTPIGDGLEPAVLTGRADTPTVLATTVEGIQRSDDAGRTWALVSGSPVIQFAALASPTMAAGIAPDGTVYTSADAGTTWKRAGKVDGRVQAMTATADASGGITVWAATAQGLLVSSDGGKSFEPYAPRG
ncbi:F510_1955 family glycosylhydrolase [Sinomonas mesophila]|uniref:F510_1955 family glycosylhydrolase n=1 Tax=Sinomonas mesophila TaxID=1531955 RepID=UPI000984F98A|nr:hypothetical protein [Sinomonas mesophila]